MISNKILIMTLIETDIYFNKSRMMSRTPTTRQEVERNLGI